MNHETLRALYQLDVEEVGEDDAVKRWEFLVDSEPDWADFRNFLDKPLQPTWIEITKYRRKPGIPWPKVMQQKIGTCTCGYSTVLNTVHRTDGPCFQYTEPQPSTQWPDDAPEWAANRLVLYTDGEGLGGADWTWGSFTNAKFIVVSNIERPKPVKQKVDWSQLRSRLRDFWSEGSNFPSHWFAWNCDEHTRGNPLPDGLMVEWLYHGNEPWHNRIDSFFHPDWDKITRFRIIGIQGGWE